MIINVISISLLVFAVVLLIIGSKKDVEKRINVLSAQLMIVTFIVTLRGIDLIINVFTYNEKILFNSIILALLLLLMLVLGIKLSFAIKEKINQEDTTNSEQK